MFNKSALSFSLKLGAISGVIWILISLSTRSGPTTVYAQGATAIIGAILIAKQGMSAFKARFAMAFGAAWVALLVFAAYVVYMRGASVPVWMHLLNIPVTFVIALIIGAAIAVVSRPWQGTAMNAA